MGTKLRLFLVLIGGLLVAATFTYPSWRPAPIGEVEAAEFPGLPAELQDDFQALPERIRRDYLLMRQVDEQQALALLRARLVVPASLSPEEQALPPVESASIIRESVFASPQLEEEDDRELPQFVDLYSAAGTVRIYQFPDERKLLRIENLQVVNGPELWVALTTHSAPLTFDEIQGYQELGPLRATSGNMNFEIPAERDLNYYHSIVIFDRPYRIIFAVARIG